MRAFPLVALLLLAPLALPIAASVAPREETKPYQYVPGVLATSGCGVATQHEVCFAVRAGERGVQVTIRDDRTSAVPYVLVAAAPGRGSTVLGTWCGAPQGFNVGLPAGTTSVRVNFDAAAIPACGSVGTNGTITVRFA